MWLLMGDVKNKYLKFIKLIGFYLMVVDCSLLLEAFEREEGSKGGKLKERK